MIKDIPYSQDEKTVLLDEQGHPSISGPMTNAADPLRIEQLQERMIFSAHLRPDEAFSVSLNGLVAAASELLSALVKLQHKQTPEEMPELNVALATGIRQFEARALHSGIENSQVMAARYVLCTVLDEAVVVAKGGGESAWSQMSLLSTFHNETFGGEKFFQLLERLSKNPVRHLPMLELMYLYLCLALGFAGKYGIHGRGSHELEDIRDALYRQIRQLRSDVPNGLSPEWQESNRQRRNLVRIVPVWMIVLFTGVCLTVMFSGFAWVLSEHRGVALQPYQPVDQVAVPPQLQP